MSHSTCTICGVNLTGRKRLYCSVTCKERKRYKSWSEHVALTARPDCTFDGCDRKHVAKGLCLMHYKRTMPKKAGDSHRGRARRNGVAFESISRLRVFERDAWLCGICGVSVDATLVFPDPMSASLDHIVPITKGGGHLYDNVQTAHLSCNYIKSDSLEVADVG